MKMKCISNITKKNNHANVQQKKEPAQLSKKSSPSIHDDNVAVQDYAYMIAKGMLSFIG